MTIKTPSVTCPDVNTPAPPPITIYTIDVRSFLQNRIDVTPRWQNNTPTPQDTIPAVTIDGIYYQFYERITIPANQITSYYSKGFLGISSGIHTVYPIPFTTDCKTVTVA
jgi:hypothetical protein